MARIPVLINAKAGRGRAPLAAPRIHRYLRRHALEADLTISESLPQTAEWAAAAAAQGGVALVGGGDGTMNTVLPYFANSPTALGILPVGTANGLARELQLPLSLGRAIEVAVEGRARAVDLGVANGRPFALMAGIGLDAVIVGQTVGPIKDLLGPWAFIVQGIAALAEYQPVDIRVLVDGEDVSFTGWMVVLGNAAVYAYTWRLAKDARIDDGLLDVMMFTARRSREVVAGVSQALAGLQPDAPTVLMRRGTDIRIESDPPLPIQLDGEPAGNTPLNVSVAAGALKVMVPR